MTTRLDGQTAIVTGAARGIGLGIAKRLAREGCRVVSWDRDAGPLEASKSEFEPALAQVVDVTDLKAVERTFAAAASKFGKIDILVNNAGVNGPTVPTWEYPPEAWDRVLSVDLTGVFYCCRAAVPHMRANRYGRIVNIASIAGKEGNPSNSAYSAAKAGVIALTKSLANELTDSGVIVNALAPAITETDLFKEMTQEFIESRRRRIPMGRFCTVDEIANMVAWVASPECSFTTGFTFDISGGRATY
jgi:NAD(P)-dependent dehydrogenase (short-subunit alcohol dehydrogenase family)